MRRDGEPPPVATSTVNEVGLSARVLEAAERTMTRRMAHLVWQSLVHTRVGWVDFVGRRYELDASGSMVRVEGRSRYVGRSGHRLRRQRRAKEASAVHEPLWLIELLRGAIEAKDAGEEEVRGMVCRHYDVVADFPRAAAASQRGMAPPFAVPEGRRAEQLDIEPWDGRHVTADAFIDRGGLVRRIHVRGFLMNVSMELFDFPAEDGCRPGADSIAEPIRRTFTGEHAASGQGL